MSHPFRFGLQSIAPASAAQWREQARRAEDLGFSTFSVADHVIGPGPALKPTRHPVQVVAVIPAMAVAAEATSTIRIGARVLCVDYRNPVMMAKELATLDFFSPGRLEVGLGAGWLQNEYEAIGVPFEPAGTRIDRLEETIGLLQAAFAPGQLDVQGRHVHAVGFEAVPTPAAMPPLMIGGGSRRVLTLAGRHADIVSLNFDNSSGRLGAEAFGSATAARTDEKIGWIREAAGDRWPHIELEVGAYLTVVDDNPDLPGNIAPMFGITADEVLEHPHVLLGSVDAICDRLVERRERFGFSYVTFFSEAMEAVAPIVARLAGT
jgi:probable F420-dependent oxidoreductase